MSILRADEKFVIESLSKHYSCEWEKGENPPDAYLLYDNKRIPVEISALVQHTVNSEGKTIPRKGQDTRASNICYELNGEIGKDIPKGKAILLHIEAPLNKPREFKRKLVNKVMEVSRKADIDTDFQMHILNKNNVGIKVTRHVPSSKKIAGFVTNLNSSPDIGVNAAFALLGRINVKALHCKGLELEGKLWLAFLNDYWLADVETYKQALRENETDNPFNRILLVDLNGTVETLYKKDTKE